MIRTVFRTLLLTGAVVAGCVLTFVAIGVIVVGVRVGVEHLNPDPTPPPDCAMHSADATSLHQLCADQPRPAEVAGADLT